MCGFCTPNKFLSEDDLLILLDNQTVNFLGLLVDFYHSSFVFHFAIIICLLLILSLELFLLLLEFFTSTKVDYYVLCRKVNVCPSTLRWFFISGSYSLV